MCKFMCMNYNMWNVKTFDSWLLRVIKNSELIFLTCKIVLVDAGSFYSIDIIKGQF